MPLRLSETPLSTGAAAIYPFSEKLQRQFTGRSRFDDIYPMYRVLGKGKRIALPREFCPVNWDNDLREYGESYPFESVFVPRNDEQKRVVAESTALLKKGRSFVTRAPTGFGKTWCAMDVIAKLGLKTMVVVTKEDVRDQWIAACNAVLGIKPGVVQGRSVNTSQPITIAMVQTLAKYSGPPHVWKGIGLTIFDEVHRMGADVFSNACFMLPSLLRWGLSATPERADGKDELIRGGIGPTMVETEHMLLTPTVFRVMTDHQFPEWLRKRQQPGRLAAHAKDLSKDRKRNHFIAKFVAKMRTVDRRVIVFSESLDHLDYLRAACIKLGLPAKDMAHYVGGLTKQEREANKHKPILFATYAYTSEATDIPWLDTMVMATPRSDVVQIVGRILREYEDKRFPIVLDIVDPLKVYMRFANKRVDWYQEINAEVRGLKYG